MGNSKKSQPFLFYVFLSLFVLALISCGTFSSIVTAPTATLPAKVDSPLKDKLVGKWNVSGSAPWNDTTFTFNDDGSLVVDGLEGKSLTGSYFFTSENIVAYTLPIEQGTISLEFQGDDNIDLTITKSSDVFGLIASAQRVK